MLTRLSCFHRVNLKILLIVVLMIRIFFMKVGQREWDYNSMVYRETHAVLHNIGEFVDYDLSLSLCLTNFPCTK